MALSNVPYRSEVLAWGPDELAEYFKKLNYKDCEKVVKKHHISGPRFLNLSENDIQKFPKLRVPILSKLSQEINKNEERRSLFARKPHPQKFADEREFQEEEDGGWSSFDEDDDYESPTEDADGEEDGDYESPNEEEAPALEDEADYEPPPSNDEDTMQNTILPAKIPSGSMYIDRPLTGKTPQQPPVPPQRPLPGTGGRNNTPPHLPQPSHEEPMRGRNHRTPNFPAPSIDRSKKPPLDRTLPQFERDSLAIGKKPLFPDKPSAPALRPAGDHLPKIQKPPLPPGERPERNFKKPPVPKHGWAADRRDVSTKQIAVNKMCSKIYHKSLEGRSWGGQSVHMRQHKRISMILGHIPQFSKSLLCPPDFWKCQIYILYQGHPENDVTPVNPFIPDYLNSSFFFTTVQQRPLPQPALPSFTSNTFPSRSIKPPSRFPQSGSNSMPGPMTTSIFPSSSTLPPYLSKGPFNRPPSRGPAEGRPLPVPVRQQHLGDEENSLNNEWYVSYITRTEAEAALRKINKDGTFLVRDSSKKTVTNPYVLMVLYKNKVYNIQIRYNEESQVYLLGTGLRGKEDFLSVPDIIDYFRRMPLLLIDGKNRDSRNQCMLIYAAGYP
ncbi:lymphocyte cytosolic protein 2 [Monodelphis domestica]|uniref:lymphocyte cytosolic protein 2 n=1 Tax=Monodelphis domestica TaxID=13616 RepID=UPI0024E233DF|nr:lymphocyte cytosolic protein 2 [Monodelphis domestica]